MGQLLRIQEEDNFSLTLSRLRPRVAIEEAELFVNLESALDCPQGALSVFLKPLFEPELSGQQTQSTLNYINFFPLFHYPILPDLSREILSEGQEGRFLLPRAQFFDQAARRLIFSVDMKLAHLLGVVVGEPDESVLFDVVEEAFPRGHFKIRLKRKPEASFEDPALEVQDDDFV